MSTTRTLQQRKPGWLGRFIQRPRPTLLRRVCFQIHLWAGVAVSLYIAAIGISGSILVFKDELMPRPKLAGAPAKPAACTPETLLAAVDAALADRSGAQVVLASCPTDANPFYQVTVKPGAAAAITEYVNPATDQVAGTVNQSDSWIGWVDHFHLDLLLQNNGRQWNGAGAAALVALVLTGLVLWWPGIRNWTRALKVDLRLGWRRINYDLHSALGIWTVLFTAVWAVTGVYFAWERPFESIISAISPITTARYPAEEIDRVTRLAAASQKRIFVVKSALEKALAETPGCRLEGFFYGSDAAPVFTVYMAHGRLGDYASTDFVYFNQRNGEHLLTWYRGVNHTLGDWLLWLFVPLHFGTSFGMAGKVAWAAFGLAFPTMALTGLLMYWNRWLSKRISLP